MTKITDKVKEKMKDVKDKVVDTKDKVADTTKDTVGAGTKVSSKSDSIREYEAREPMSPAKIKEHEPTAVKREMTEKITQGGKRATDLENAKEIARKSGMAKGTAGAEESGDSESENDSGSETVE
jgi:general stress protein YciG